METERCLLKKVRGSDYSALKALFQNQKTRAFLGGIRNEDEFQEIFAGMVQAHKDACYWVIREKDSQEFIGLISLDRHHNGINTEISYQFLPCWWGQGYAFETITNIISFAFDTLGLPEIVAETQAKNIASCKLLEKIGMQYIEKYDRFNEKQVLYRIEKGD